MKNSVFRPVRTQLVFEGLLLAGFIFMIGWEVAHADFLFLLFAPIAVMGVLQVMRARVEVDHVESKVLVHKAVRKIEVPVENVECVRSPPWGGAKLIVKRDTGTSRTVQLPFGSGGFGRVLSTVEELSDSIGAPLRKG